MFEEYIKCLLESLSFLTVQSDAEGGAPFGAENKKCLDFVLEKGIALGFQAYNGGGYYGILTTTHETNVSRETYFVLGHLDVVPVGNDWTKNPRGEISDGKIFGRGVMDDKGPMLACLFAAAELARELGAPKRPLKFIFGCNEESGWHCMDKYIEDFGKPGEGFSPDGNFPVINCEKGVAYYHVSVNLPPDVKSVCGGERPNMVMDKCTVALVSGEKFTEHGKSAHGSKPQLGVNAFLNSVKKIKSLKNIYEIFKDPHGSDANIDFEDEKSGKLTVNIGKAWTEEGVLTFTLDIRYPVTCDKSLILKNLQKALPEAKIADAGGHDPLYFAPDNKNVRDLLFSYEKITGQSGKPIAIGGATYARAMTDGVAFGPQLPWQADTIHQKDECAEIADLKLMYEIYKEAIKRAIY